MNQQNWTIKLKDWTIKLRGWNKKIYTIIVFLLLTTMSIIFLGWLGFIAIVAYALGGYYTIKET
ncbi:hypothetical protein KKA66_03370, partial [Patescibacteria group bacterium]|nr:hypothetical protein [Patescibacteria group bacterium]